MKRQFRSRRDFELYITETYGSQGTFSKRNYKEETNEEGVFVNLTLYYLNDKHFATWQKTGYVIFCEK